MTRHDDPGPIDRRLRATEIYRQRAALEDPTSARSLAFGALVVLTTPTADERPTRETQILRDLALRVLGVDAHPWVAIVGLCDPDATLIRIHCACGVTSGGRSFAAANAFHEAHRAGTRSPSWAVDTSGEGAT